MVPAFEHGREVTLPDGTVVLGCYHPSLPNTNTGLLTAGMLDAVLQQARRRAAIGLIDSIEG